MSWSRVNGCTAVPVEPICPYMYIYGNSEYCYCKPRPSRLGIPYRGYRCPRAPVCVPCSCCRLQYCLRLYYLRNTCFYELRSLEPTYRKYHTTHRNRTGRIPAALIIICHTDIRCGVTAVVAFLLVIIKKKKLQYALLYTGKCTAVHTCR